MTINYIYNNWECGGIDFWMHTQSFSYKLRDWIKASETAK